MNTYNTKLQTNNTNLSDILDKVNALPETKNVNTCTVQINVTSDNVPRLASINTIILNNGEVVAYDNTEQSSSYTIENVVCGAIMAITTSGSGISSITMPEGGVLVHSYWKHAAIRIPFIHDTTHIISVNLNGGGGTN